MDKTENKFKRVVLVKIVIFLNCNYVYLYQLLCILIKVQSSLISVFYRNLFKANIHILKCLYQRKDTVKIPLEKGKATHSSILAWRIPWAL